MSSQKVSTKAYYYILTAVNALQILSLSTRSRLWRVIRADCCWLGVSCCEMSSKHPIFVAMCLYSTGGVCEHVFFKAPDVTETRDNDRYKYIIATSCKVMLLSRRHKHGFTLLQRRNLSLDRDDKFPYGHCNYYFQSCYQAV